MYDADDQRRRLPAECFGRGPRWRPHLDAVELTGLDHGDVGAADEGADATVSRDPLRPARPWQVGRAGGPLFLRTLRARRAGDPRRPQHREDALVRTFDGRHGRTMAGG